NFARRTTCRNVDGRCTCNTGCEITFRRRHAARGRGRAIGRQAPTGSFRKARASGKVSMQLPHTISRRAVLRGTGALVLSFSLPAWPQHTNEAASGHAPAGARLPGNLAKNPLLDAWIRIDADGRVTAFTGKVELGQGIKTALLQVVAEELEVPFTQVSLVTA